MFPQLEQRLCLAYLYIKYYLLLKRSSHYPQFRISVRSIPYYNVLSRFLVLGKDQSHGSTKIDAGHNLSYHLPNKDIFRIV